MCACGSVLLLLLLPPRVTAVGGSVTQIPAQRTVPKVPLPRLPGEGWGRGGGVEGCEEGERCEYMCEAE